MKTITFKLFATLIGVVLCMLVLQTNGQIIKSTDNTYAEDDWLGMIQDPDVNFYKAQEAFYKYWEGRTDYKGNGYKIFKRWEYINEPRVLDNGQLQAPGYILSEYDKYIMEVEAAKSASGNWSLVGPSSYPINNTSQPTGMGRINAIAFHPTDANTIYIGAPSGGFWKTTNGGSSWTNLSSDLPKLGVSSILIDPVDPDIIYIGTGDRDGGDAPGIGVFKSIDGGLTWDQMNNTMGDVTVGAMLMHPSDEETIIAATSGGIYKTTDGGQTWAAKLSPGNFKDLQFKPGDPTVVYAAYYATSIGARFYRSSNTGDSWTHITSGIPDGGSADAGARFVIGVSADEPTYVYLVQIKASDKTFRNLLRSTDSGLSFTSRSSGPNILGYNCDGSGTASQATYDLCITVDPNDADVVYVGGINNWKSVDGGVNWSIISHWANDCSTGITELHADQHCYAWSPHNGNLYVGHDGGISYTDDYGGSWTEITNDLVITQIYKIGQGASDTDYTLFGCQDNGSAATTDGGTFTTTRGGDGTECVIDYGNSNYCYNTYIKGEIDRSTTGPTGTYTEIAATGVNGISSGDKGAWVTPYMLHETDANVMFAGYMNVYRSDNVKASPATSVSWSAISSGETATCRVLEQSPADEDILYAVRPNYWNGSNWITGNFKRSDNATASAGSVTWTACTLPGGDYPTDLEAHPTDANIVYATVDYAVYKSTDKGATWTDITGNLPSLFINCLVYDKNSDEGLYVGNQTGVWYKEADMTYWRLFSEGLPPVDVRELEIYYDATPANSRIKAATYGRGLWESDLITQSPMTYVSSTTTQNNTSGVDKGSANQEIIGIEIVTSGTNTPQNVTKFIFNTNGSTHATNDIDAAKIYYTGITSVFSATDQFGVDFANPNGVFTISGTQTLNFETNYFWLVYDIKASAAAGNFVDAECSSITVAGNTEIPTITAPFGKREINSCTFCTPTASTNDATGVTNVNFNTINNGSPGDPAYTDFTAQSTDVTIGNAYTLTVNVNTSGNYLVSAKAWIDWNRDCDFDDSGEEFDLGQVANVTNEPTSITPSIAIPATASHGNTVMRVRARYDNDPTPEPCGNHNWSEAEDYTIFIGSGATWDGSESTDWNTASNWFNNTIPTGTSDVTIPNVTNDPIIDQPIETPALTNNLTIEAGASLTINPGKALTVNGTMTNQAGTNGLILKSDITGTATLIHSTTNVSASVERYVAKYDNMNDQMYHFISSPVEVQPIQPDFVTDPPSAGYDFMAWDEPGYQWLNSKTAAGLWNDVFDDEFVVGKGYLVAWPNDETKTFEGELNSYPEGNPLVITCTNTSNGGWNLLGNPFPSSLDWDLVTKGDGMDNALYYYDNTSENYKYYIDLNGVGVGGGSRYIPPMQGFMVHAKTTGTKTLSLYNTHRTHQSSDVYYKSEILNLLTLQIHGNNKTDETVIFFHEGTTNGFDSQADAYKLFTYALEVPQIYSMLQSGTQLAINSLPGFDETAQIPIGVRVPEAGNFQINAMGIESFDAISDINLYDFVNGNSQNLKENPVYEFQTLSGGFVSDRFVLQFKAETGISESAEQLQFYWYEGQLRLLLPQRTSGNVLITNMVGQTIWHKNIDMSTTAEIPFSGYTPGAYLIRISTGTKVLTGKFIIY